MTQKEMMAQMQAMMAKMETLAKENEVLKSKSVRKLPEITVEAQEIDGFLLLKVPVLRERYASDKGKSGTTLFTTGFNKSAEVKGISGAKAVIRVYIPN